MFKALLQSAMIFMMDNSYDGCVNVNYTARYISIQKLARHGLKQDWYEIAMNVWLHLEDTF